MAAGQRPSLAPLLGITLQQGVSASHGAAGFTIALVFLGSDRNHPTTPGQHRGSALESSRTPSSHGPNGDGSLVRCPQPWVGDAGRCSLPNHLPAVGNGAYNTPCSLCKVQQTVVV